MTNPIAIIGSSEDKFDLIALLAREGLHDVTILTPEDAQQLSTNLIAPKEAYFQFLPMPKLYFNNENPFICKGLHEYRRVEIKEENFTKVQWVCQCGRKTTD